MLPPASATNLSLLALALGLSTVLAIPAPAEQAAGLVKRDSAAQKSKSKSLSASRASASKAKSLASKSKSLSRSRSARDATSSKKAVSKSASVSKASASKAKSAASRSSSLSKASASKSKASASKSKSTKTSTTTKSASATSTATAAASCFKYDDIDPHVVDYKEGLSAADFNRCSVACESEVGYVGLHGTGDAYCFCLDLDAASYKTLSKKKVASSYCDTDYAHVGDYVSVKASTIEFNGNICDATEEGPFLGSTGCESNCFDVSQIADTSVPYTLTLPSTSNFVSAPLLCQYACGQREVYQYFGLTSTFECYCLGTVGAGPKGTTKYNVSSFGAPVEYSLCDGEEGFGSTSGSYISLYATDYKFV